MADCGLTPIWQLDAASTTEPYDLGRYLNGTQLDIQLIAVAQDIGQGALFSVSTDINPDTGEGTGAVTAVTVLSGGYGYSAATTQIEIIPTTSTPPTELATANAVINNGVITSVVITEPGLGYIVPPAAVAVVNQTITYSLVGGELPASVSTDPIRLTSTGELIGTLAAVVDETSSSFVVRATDLLGNYRDQTFTLTVYAINRPTLSPQPSSLLVVASDSIWVDTAIAYKNPNPELPVTFSVSSGSLPPGLWLTNDGVINGYPKAPGYGYNFATGAFNSINNITQAEPGVVTTSTPVTYTNGQAVYITGVEGMTEINNRIVYAGNISGNTFSLYTSQDLSLPLNTTAFAPFLKSGRVTSILYAVSQSADRQRRIFLKGNATGVFSPGGYISLDNQGRQTLQISLYDPSMEDEEGNPFPGIWYDAVSNTTNVLFADPDLQVSVFEGQVVYTIDPFRFFDFTVTLENSAGVDIKNYRIRVNNQAFTPGTIPDRKPVILNAQPLTQEVDELSEFYSFYTPGVNSLGSVKHNTYFAWKFIGYDFNGRSVSYQITGLDQIPGMRFDYNTGWLVGTLPNLGNATTTFRLNVRAISIKEISYTQVLGDWATFEITVQGDVDATVNWITPENLGSIDNGAISTLAVRAENTAGLELEYLLSGVYPVDFSAAAYTRISQSLAMNGIDPNYQVPPGSNYTALLAFGIGTIDIRPGMDVRFVDWPSNPYPKVVEVVGNTIIVDQLIPPSITVQGQVDFVYDSIAISGDAGTIVHKYSSTDYAQVNTNNFNNITSIAAAGGSILGGGFASNPGFVAGDSGGRIMNSSDGENWRFNETVLPAGINRIKYYANLAVGSTNLSGFYLVGNSYLNFNETIGLLRYSSTGSEWLQIDTNNLGTVPLRDVAANNQKIVVVGDRYTVGGVTKASIYQGNLGANFFEPVDFSLSQDLLGVATGTVSSTTLYIAVGTAGTILTSTDALAWTARPIANFSEDLTSVTFDGTRFVIVGTNGTIVTASFNASPVYAIIASGVSYDLTNIVYYNNSIPPSVTPLGYLITGTLGAFLLGTDLANLTAPISSNLPPNLELLSTGDLSGRVAFETGGSPALLNTNIPYTFTVEAASIEYPAIRSTRQFTVNVFQRWQQPYQTLYMRAFPPLDDREKLAELLEDTGIVGVEVTAGGQGYTAPPAVTIATPGIATARLTLNDAGGVRTITVLEPGYNYSAATPPAITIDPPVAGATTWRPQAPTSLGSILSYLDTGINQLNFYRVIAVSGTNLTGTVPPTFTFGSMISGQVELDFAGTQATAAATVDTATGRIRNAVITNPGRNYDVTTTPNVVFAAPPGAQTATAVASVVRGVVTGITVTSAGAGYQAEPVVTIAPSPLGAAYTATATSVMYMPTNIIYRPEDQYFGKSNSIVYQHQFGVQASTYQKYIDSVGTNFNQRRLILGDVETALAKDINGNVVYEAVYARIVDDLENNGVSVSKSITLRKPVPINNENYYTSTNTAYASSGILPRFRGSIEITLVGGLYRFSVTDLVAGQQIQVGNYISVTGISSTVVVSAYNSQTGLGTIVDTSGGTITLGNYSNASIGIKVWFTALSQGRVGVVYPASLVNMRLQIANNIPINPDSSLLPLWMTSQQDNGSALGFTPAWVICYTQPGFGQEVRRTIRQYYPYKFNVIDFQIDRFEVDRSATYDWNITGNTTPNGSWADLPSAVPVPAPLDSEDWYVYFPKKTILR